MSLVRISVELICFRYLFTCIQYFVMQYMYIYFFGPICFSDVTTMKCTYRKSISSIYSKKGLRSYFLFDSCINEVILHHSFWIFCNIDVSLVDSRVTKWRIASKERLMNQYLTFWTLGTTWSPKRWLVYQDMIKHGTERNRNYEMYTINLFLDIYI